MSFDEIKIVFEDSAMLVVDKPASLSVHNGPINLIELLAEQRGVRLKPVHRLDSETSGLILLAKTAEAAAELQASLSASGCHKEYLAVTRGAPSALSGDWTAPLTTKAEGRRAPAGQLRDRVEAHTRFEVLDQTPWLSLLRCQLFTGRQHQIRKHAALAGCHLLGDRRYGDPKHAKAMKNRFKLDHTALHAARLTFTTRERTYALSAAPPLDWDSFGFEELTAQRRALSASR